jgi:two-component system CitB family sensor kinase
VGRLARSLSSQIFLYQLLILAGTLLVGFALALSAVQRRLDDEYEQRALAVARSVAATPEIVRALERGDRSGVVQVRAERVRRETRTSFVVVADVRGIRFSHPNPANIGKRVSTPPEALSGRTVVAVEEGTLGRSARAKVPVRAPDGTIVGQVSVGVLEASIRDKLGTIVPAIALYAGIAMLAGLGASLLLSRRLKRQTFGLELSELAELLQEREAMLHGVREGVVAVDPAGRIRVVNAQARRLLDLAGDVVGQRPAEAVGSGRLADLLEGRIEGQDDLLLVHGERVLVANRMPVRHQQRDLGAVVTLRDRTELEGLVRELGSVRDLTDAMRAQAHEFSNRMHTVSGLLQLGHYDEAVDFVKATTAADTAFRRALGERIADPVIAALLLAKAAVAAERGVALRLTEHTGVAAELADARAALTVLGNLIDNAIDAARLGDDPQPWVEVDLRLDLDAALLITVADSGLGVPVGAREAVFEAGWSTKPSVGLGARGVGLSLVRRLAERRGGAVMVADHPGGGAVFVVRLPVRSLPDARREPEEVAP